MKESKKVKIMSKRRKTVSSTEAIEDILRFVEESDNEEEEIINDLDDLHGDNDDFIYEEEENEQNQEEGDIQEIPRHRKMLTPNRLVRSIESAQDISNYDPLILPSSHVTYKTTLRDTDDKTVSPISFTTKPPINSGRRRQCDVIKEPLGVRGIAKECKTEIDCWKLFITEQMIDIIIESTNRNIAKTIVNLQDKVESGKYGYLRSTNKDEIEAFLGLIYYRGLYNLSGISAPILFSDTKGLPMFGAVMSRDRFMFLISRISFDNPDTRTDRWKRDRFAAFREFFELFNENCSRYITPGEFLSIDETLYPMRHQIAFRQYNPDKPAKYGMLFKSLNAAGFPYLHRTIVYSGRPEGEPNEYYNKGTSSYVKALVNGTERHVSLQGRNISMDRLYTSISTTRWLLSHNITMIGTMQSNRSGIPNEIKSMNDREDLSTIIYWCDDTNTVLSSYVVKTKSGKKNVLLLSTMTPTLGITKDDGKKKPAQYKLYDFTKGGTDECDKRAETYCCKPKSRKWTIVSLCYVLDMARINSSTILALNRNETPRKSSVSSFDFCWNLVQSLAVPFILSRPWTGLQKNVQLKISSVLGGDMTQRRLQEPQDRDMSKRKRCRDCMD